MFPGRVVLGVGTGESLNEVPSSGIAWPGAKERRDRLREAIRLINKLWTEDRVTFEGQFYRTESATIYDKPKSTRCRSGSPPRGRSRRQMAGQIAEGFICTSGKNPQLYTDLIGKVAEGAAPGRAATPPTSSSMIEVKVSFDSRRQQAKELTRHWAALALSPEEKMGVEDPIEMERLADALPLDRAASRWIVSSDPDEQVERIRPYVESASATSCSTPPAPTRRGSSNSMPNRSCRACARLSADSSALLRNSMTMYQRQKLPHCRRKPASTGQLTRKLDSGSRLAPGLRNDIASITACPPS